MRRRSDSPDARRPPINADTSLDLGGTPAGPATPPAAARSGQSTSLDLSGPAPAARPSATGVHNVTRPVRPVAVAPRQPRRHGCVDLAGSVRSAAGRPNSTPPGPSTSLDLGAAPLGGRPAPAAHRVPRRWTCRPVAPVPAGQPPVTRPATTRPVAGRRRAAPAPVPARHSTGRRRHPTAPCLASNPAPGKGFRRF